MGVVWDTGAFTLFFADHIVAKTYMREMISGRVKGYVLRIIMAEFFYKVCQKFGKDVALVRLALIRRTGICEE